MVHQRQLEMFVNHRHCCHQIKLVTSASFPSTLHTKTKRHVILYIIEDPSVCFCAMHMCVCLYVPNTLLNHITQWNQTLHEGISTSMFTEGQQSTIFRTWFTFKPSKCYCNARAGSSWLRCTNSIYYVVSPLTTPRIPNITIIIHNKKFEFSIKSRATPGRNASKWYKFLGFNQLINRV